MANTLKQTHPTLSVRVRRHCETCDRLLPKSAYRRQCATCIKRQSGKLRFDHWTVIRQQYQTWLKARAEVVS